MRRTKVRASLEALESRTMLSALSPTQIRHAYGFDMVAFNSNGTTVAADGTGQTIAIVTAYDDPNISKDLATFDAKFGLSNSDGKGSPVLTKVKMNSRTGTDSGWALETSLDVEWSHAIAPGAHILLVEARSSSLTDLLSAVNYARQQSGVVAVSMSWGSAEFSGETSYDNYFTTPSGHIGGSGLKGGVAFIAASGDSGSPATWPSASPNVLSVGGTTLTLDSSGNYLSETAWSGSGGGPAKYEKNGTPTVAYDADPNSGFQVYDSVSYYGSAGWFTVGGTSAGAPQWAALVAIIDQGRSILGKGSLDGATQLIPAIKSLPAADFHDILTGSNGGYTAGPGYDYVTGYGTPVANKIITDLTSSTVTVAAIKTATTTTSTSSPATSTTTTANQNTGSASQSSDWWNNGGLGYDWFRHPPRQWIFA